MKRDEDWNYFSKDPQYADVLKSRLDAGVEMDSAVALASYMARHFQGDLHVVDFGAGPGHYWPVIRRLYGAGTVTYLGVDIDEGNVRYGNDHFRGDPRCRLCVGSVLEPETIEADAADVNCVVSANTLPHVPTVVPLLSWMARSPRIRSFAFRMLIGSECVQIKKHLREHGFDGLFERDFQYNNIYSVPFIQQHLGPEWDLLIEPDVFDEARLQEHRVEGHGGAGDQFYANRVSRLVGSLVFKGDVYMPWKFVIGRRV
jgi:SAM-dependent methyltransferase